jgi:hypothetical protein
MVEVRECLADVLARALGSHMGEATLTRDR